MGFVRVTPTPATVGAVRSMLRDDLAGLPDVVKDDVALVVSELLGNALRHGSSLDDGRLAVAWDITDGGVEVAVTDGGGPTFPSVGLASPTEIGGRGLSIVDTVSVRWGVDRCGHQTTVWAIVPVRLRSFAPA